MLTAHQQRAQCTQRGSPGPPWATRPCHGVALLLLLLLLVVVVVFFK
jgi:hypothetical protein